MLSRQMCCYWLLFLLYISFIVPRGECKTWTTHGILTGGNTTHNSIAVEGLNTYMQAHVYLVANWTLYNNTPVNDSSPLMIEATASKNNHTMPLWTLQLNQTAMVQFIQPPCRYSVDNGTTLTLLAKENSPSKSSFYNVSIGITVFPTQLAWGANHNDNADVCPKYRYFVLDVPKDGYGYNITMTSSSSSFASAFNGAYLRWNDCPDVSEGLFDIKASNLSTVATREGYTFELDKGGQWWLALQCASDYVKQWELTINSQKTCLLGCIERGYCNPNAPSPYCVCDYFHTGDDCSKLYPGDFVLVAVATLALVLIISCIAWRVAKRRKAKKDWKNFDGMMESVQRPLLRKESDYDGEIYEST